MKLVFFGSGAFGLPTLRALLAEHGVVLVVTQPDRPAGRRRRLAPTPVGSLAEERGLEVIRAENVNEPEVAGRIRAAGADAFVVIAFGQKIGPDVLGNVLALNLHASLLPRYRGAAPINWAVINGDSETGVSVIAISQRIDAGDVLAREATPIDPMETAGELEDRLAELGPRVMLETLSRYESGQLHPAPQDDRLASRAPKLSKADGTVSFDQPADAVRNRVHGLTPWPGCTVALEGERLKLLRVEVVEDAATGREPGVVLKDGAVACGTGRVRLLSVQPAGGKSMSFDAYRLGHALVAESRMESL
ncbi:MAG: methionyl-tRNA formyltransferase [Planctomycetota bacterium]|jgi:methionyl-tRNA formyltransferase